MNTKLYALSSPPIGVHTSWNGYKTFNLIVICLVWQVMICEESHNVQDMSFVIYIARVSPVVTDDLLVHAAGKYNLIW